MIVYHTVMEPVKNFTIRLAKKSNCLPVDESDKRPIYLFSMKIFRVMLLYSKNKYKW